MPKLAAGERVGILGLPGWGKTVLSQSLVAGASSVVILDSKLHPDEWQAWAPAHGYVVTDQVADVLRFPKVVFKVDQLWLEDRRGWSKPGSVGYQWTELLQALFRRRNTIVVFDEAMQTLPVAQPHPDARRLFTQGRAHRITVIVGSQAPLHVDTVVLRLAEHFFCFGMFSEDYRNAIRGQRGVGTDELAELEKHEFAYHHQGERAWQLFAPLALPSQTMTSVTARPSGELPSEPTPDGTRDHGLPEETRPA